MLKRVLLIAFIILWWSPVSAELVDTAWVRFYNGGLEDFPVAVGADFWGNVYVTGYSYGNGTDKDYATVKYNPRGEMVWVRRFNGSANSDDRAEAIAVDHDGNVYVTGKSTGIWGDLDCATVKYYPDGDTAWVRRYEGPSNGHDYGYDIVIDEVGFAYVVGSVTVNDGDFLVIKYYPDGDTAWVRRYSGPGPGSAYAYAVVLDDSGNVYATGSSWEAGTESDFVTVKYYSDGELAWAKRYDGPIHHWDHALDITLDNSYNVYVTGRSWIEQFHAQYVTIKYDHSGNQEWIKRFTEIEAAQFRVGADHLATDDSGNVYSSANVFEGYALLIKYDPDGSIVWIREQHGIYSDAYISNIGWDIYGDLYVIGVCDNQYLTVKYNPQGDLLWTQKYDAPTSGWPGPEVDLALDPMGNVYVAGQGNKNYGNYIVIKYVQFWYSRGDVNQDDEVSIVDVVYLLNYLFKSGPAPVPYLALGDADGDADIDISDILYLIDYIFKRGPKPCL